MTRVDTVFSGSIPALYDRYLGPLIFESYAADIARRLSDLKTGAVLEIAAGTGIVTRALMGSLPAAVGIVATDLNQAMLDLAAVKDATSRVSWQQADAQALPFPDAAFDAVVCQFGVMFFPDKQKAYREARRVLKPRGRFLFNVWDKLADNEIADLVTGAMAGLFPNDPPRFMARTPHGYNDRDAILAEVRSGGFADITVETLTKRSVAPSARDAVIGYVQGSPLRSEIEARDASRLAEATDAAASKVRASFGDGPVDAKIQALVFTAR